MSYGFENQKSFLNFSNNQERAVLIDNDFDTPMARSKKTSKRKSRKGTKKVKYTKGLKITKGRINLRVAGYTGLQKVAASDLIRFISLGKLRVAAKKVLKRSGKKTNKKKRKGRKKKSE